MKIKISLTSLLLLNFFLLSSQVPQGFNYQAIAHDANGGPVANSSSLQVKFSILSDTILPTIVWEELHNPVKTNSTGVFNLVIGTGVRQAGSASTFTDIDWKTTPLYLKIQIYYQNEWKYLGSAKLWSVPYSMVAGDLDGSLKKLAVIGTTSAMDEALFEVKNKNGQTVFAVYNEGVRVYVDDGVTKGTKGGFAIGGFGTTKAAAPSYFVVSPDSIRAYVTPGTVKGTKGGFAIGGFDTNKGTTGEEYLRVSRDSTRVYIDDKSKGTKGGFAIGGFGTDKGVNASFFDVTANSEGVINPSQNRILWYPVKNAFLAGKVLIEKPDSVGINSFATGYESKATGPYSQALGYQSIAGGPFSTSIGYQSVARKNSSFAFGQWAQARSAESYAFGKGAIAEGFRSFSFGSAGVDSAGTITGVTYAKGDYSFAVGLGSQSTGTGAFAMGLADTARGDFSFSLGYKTKASGYNSIALGGNTIASNRFATATGYFCTASGTGSTSMGVFNNAVGDYSVALGEGNITSGIAATAMGDATNASGHYSTAMGSYTKSIGDNSTATGYYTTANGKYSVAEGWNTVTDGIASTAMGFITTGHGDYSFSAGYWSNAFSYASAAFGRYNVRSGSISSWIDTDPLFVIGNGTSLSSPNNAFTVLKNGNIGIGNANPSQKLDVTGNARFSAVTSGAYAAPLNITVDGTLTTSSSDISLKKNIVPINEALQKVLRMKGVFFSWKSDTLNSRRVGFIAQDMEKVLPEVVFTNPADGLKGINYPEITAVLVQAIKEQDQKIESQQKELEELKVLVNNLIAKQTAQGK